MNCPLVVTKVLLMLCRVGIGEYVAQDEELATIETDKVGSHFVEIAHGLSITENVRSMSPSTPP